MSKELEPYFDEVNLTRYTIDGILSAGYLQALSDAFIPTPNWAGGLPRVLSLNFQGISAVDDSVLDDLGELVNRVVRHKKLSESLIFVRLVNLNKDLPVTIGQILADRDLVVATRNTEQGGEKTVRLIGKERSVQGYSSAFNILAQIDGWINPVTFMHDNLGISLQDARRKLQAMSDIGIVIIKGNLRGGVVVHSLV